MRLRVFCKIVMPKMQSMVSPLDARLTRTLAYLQETLGASFGSVGEI